MTVPWAPQVHYESHNIHEETPVGSGGGLFGSGAGLQQDGPGWSSPSTAPSGSANSSVGGGGSRKSGLSGIGTSGIKRASLFTWLTLQSIKRETTVSPNILEFLELALEPLPVTDPNQKPAATSQGMMPLLPSYCFCPYLYLASLFPSMSAFFPPSLYCLQQSSSSIFSMLLTVVCEASIFF